MASENPEDQRLFAELTSKDYVFQAKWWLNAFWNQGAEDDAGRVWDAVHKFAEIDVENGLTGVDLDERQSHILLEALGETLTALQLREKLRQIDLDMNKRMSLLEYLLYSRSKPMTELVNAPQESNQKEIQKAEKMLKDVQKALEDVQLQEQLVREAEAKAKIRAEESRVAEGKARDAEAEAKAAVEALEAEETAYAKTIADLEAKSQEGGIVSRNRAAAQLAQVKAEDPMPLRKAKLTSEAALRRSKKATQAAADAVVAAEAAQAAAADAVVEAQQSVINMESKFEAAVAYLDEVKAKPGSGKGTVWWLERELEESKKYMSKKKLAELEARLAAEAAEAEAEAAAEEAG